MAVNPWSFFSLAPFVFRPEPPPSFPSFQTDSWFFFLFQPAPAIFSPRTLELLDQARTTPFLSWLLFISIPSSVFLQSAWPIAAWLVVQRSYPEVFLGGPCWQGPPCSSSVERSFPGSSFLLGSFELSSSRSSRRFFDTPWAAPILALLPPPCGLLEAPGHFFF